jgi:2-polyprenyl-6-methoxyphenol hydroxylase-like FAD-dependent oxidoreductase
LNRDGSFDNWRIEMTATPTINLPARDVEVAGDYDVVVCGGGPAGCAAALGAARSGSKTLLIEQSGCLGGTATISMNQHLARFTAYGHSPDIAGGIADEVFRRSIAEGGGMKWLRAGAQDVEDHLVEQLMIDFEGFKLLLDRMMEEAGVEIFFYTQLADAVVEDGRIVAAIVTNKSGCYAVRAKRFIDCTGDADLAFRAGCPTVKGRPQDGRMQPVSMMYRVGGVDVPLAQDYYSFQDPHMAGFCRKAHELGLLDWQTSCGGLWWNKNRPGEVVPNFSHMHVDATDFRDLTRACILGRRQVQEAFKAMKALVPAFKDSFLIDTAPYIGIRETRRIDALYTMTVDDIRNATIFEDSIGLGSSHTDVHNPDGPGQDAGNVFRLPDGKYYSIPYRTLVPRGVANLVVAGRCHGASHGAVGSTRFMAQCLIMGEAAGRAASLGIERGVGFAELPVRELQARLERAGAILR